MYLLLCGVLAEVEFEKVFVDYKSADFRKHVSPSYRYIGASEEEEVRRESSFGTEEIEDPENDI